MRHQRIIPRRNNEPLNANNPVDHLLQWADTEKFQAFGYAHGYLVRIPLLKYDEMHKVKGIEDWRYPVASNYYYTDQFIELPKWITLNHSEDLDYKHYCATLHQVEGKGLVGDETYIYKTWVNYDGVTICRSEDTSLMVAIHDCFVKLNWSMRLFDKKFKEK